MSTSCVSTTATVSPSDVKSPPPPNTVINPHTIPPTTITPNTMPTNRIRRSHLLSRQAWVQRVDHSLLRQRAPRLDHPWSTQRQPAGNRPPRRGTLGPADRHTGLLRRPRAIRQRYLPRRLSSRRTFERRTAGIPD